MTITSDRLSIMYGDIAAATASMPATSRVNCPNDAVLISGGCQSDAALRSFGVRYVTAPAVPGGGYYEYFCGIGLEAGKTVRSHALCLDTTP